MQPARLIQFGAVMVQVWPSSIVTILGDGQQVYAMPQDNDEYRATAERLGYGADTSRMSREHELLHSALAFWLGLAESPTVGRVARGEGNTRLTGLEEDAVCAIAAFCNAAGIDLLAALSR